MAFKNDYIQFSNMSKSPKFPSFHIYVLPDFIDLLINVNCWKFDTMTSSKS